MVNILSMLSDIFDKLTCIFTILLVCGRSDGAKLGHDVKEGQIHADAMKYLVKYGYLDCFPRELKFKTSTVFQGKAVSSMRECSKQEIGEGTRKMQHVMKLPQTGDIDVGTTSLMQLRRCGDKDTNIKTQLETSSTYYRSMDDSNSVDDKSERLMESKKSSTRVRRGSLKLMEVDDAMASDHEFKQWLNTRVTPFANPPVENLVEEDRTETMNRMRRKIMESLNEEDNRQAHREKREIFEELSEAHKRRVMQRRRSRNRRSTGLSSVIYWSLPAGSSRIPWNISIAEIEMALKKWSRSIPLLFRRIPAGSSAWENDVEFMFWIKEHGDDRPFDGTGGELAHSRSNDIISRKEVHFDDDEFYESSDSGNESINLQKVAVHEIGHVLGLGHSADSDSVMNPIYHNPGQSGTRSIELSDTDKRNIQAIHGVCKGHFDAVVDMIYTIYDEENDKLQHFYNTLFYRDDHYWKYENLYKRTTWNHPLPIAETWGLPNKIDAVVQVMNSRCTSSYIQTYIFKGESFYLYDENTKSVVPGYPKLISEHFGSIDGGSSSVPNNLDAVFYDRLMTEFYFFKGQSVWIYDACLAEQNGCCNESGVPFSDHFTMHPHSTKHVSGYISSVHLSVVRKIELMIQGEDVYEMHPVENLSRHWQLLYIGPWFEIWPDICDV